MKDLLKNLGWAVLGVSLLPIAKFLANLCVTLVLKSPRKEDDIFVKELCKSILEKLQ